MTITHTERIECPSCNHAQEAMVEETALYPVRVHQCAACGYWITESE
jgi:ribosomal protein L37E